MASSEGSAGTVLVAAGIEIFSFRGTGVSFPPDAAGAFRLLGVRRNLGVFSIFIPAGDSPASAGA